MEEFQGLNTPLKSQSGGLGHLMHIMDEVEGFPCFSSIDLASRILQLELYEEDRHLREFRDADEKQWEYVRCGFGLKTVSPAFTNYVGE